MPENVYKPAARRQALVTQDVEKEVLIYDLQTNKAFNLNETASLVWRTCDGTKTVSEISDVVSKNLKSPVSEEFVWLALDQLKKENLIEDEKENSIQFSGLTRRDVIRRVGLTSMVALPMISSLIAPTAAHAQSTANACAATTGRPLGCTCTANTQCTGTTTTRCCSNVPGTSRTCVPARTLRTTGETCGNNCDCVSNNCVGPTGNGVCG